MRILKIEEIDGRTTKMTFDATFPNRAHLLNEEAYVVTKGTFDTLHERAGKSEAAEVTIKNLTMANAQLHRDAGKAEAKITELRKQYDAALTSVRAKNEIINNLRIDAKERKTPDVGEGWQVVSDVDMNAWQTTLDDLECENRKLKQRNSNQREAIEGMIADAEKLRRQVQNQGINVGLYRKIAETTKKARLVSEDDAAFIVREVEDLQNGILMVLNVALHNTFEKISGARLEKIRDILKVPK